MSDDRYLVGSLARGVEVLRCFGRQRPTLSLTEVAGLLGWNRSEPFRFLRTWEALGYLRRDPSTKRFELTTRVLDLGFAALASLPLPELAQPFLERLRDITDGSAHVGVSCDTEVIYVGRAASRQHTNSMIRVGSRLPAHATAIGKALLASHSDEWITAWLAQHTLERFTATTLTETQAFLAEVRRIRSNGYAVSNQEYEDGIRSVAFPVIDENGIAVAAVNMSAPAASFSIASVRDVIVPAVREAAAGISHMIGRR